MHHRYAGMKYASMLLHEAMSPEGQLTYVGLERETSGDILEYKPSCTLVSEYERALQLPIKGAIITQKSAMLGKSKEGMG